MERAELLTFLPRTKFEIERAEAVVALGFPAVEPVLPELLRWLQDINWPVAQALLPLLSRIGAPLAPHLRLVLEGQDGGWKYNVLNGLVAPSPELRAVLAQEIRRLAREPAPEDVAEQVDVAAREALGSESSSAQP